LQFYNVARHGLEPRLDGLETEIPPVSDDLILGHFIDWLAAECETALQHNSAAKAEAFPGARVGRPDLSELVAPGVSGRKGRRVRAYRAPAGEVSESCRLKPLRLKPVCSPYRVKRGMTTARSAAVAVWTPFAEMFHL
jgi:hypothetical protein